MMEPDPREVQIERLAQFIMAEIPGEPSISEGAVDCAIRLLGDGVRFRSALQKIAGADLKRCGAGWLQAIAKETLGNLEATPRAVLPHTPKFGPVPYGLKPHTPSWCGAGLNVAGPIAAVPDLNAPRPSRWTKENAAGIRGHVFNEPLGESVQCVKCGAPFKDAYYNPACSADG